MKIMIASDIHGSSYWCRKMADRFEKSGAERLILLGDILYHGPRNALPRDYDPQKTSAILNGLADRIVCVRGNCDCEVDQMMLDFPILAEYAVLLLDGQIVYLQHGHKQSVPAAEGMTILSGHTHIPLQENRGGILYLNPGSVSIPKNGSRHSVMLWEDGEFSWIDLENGE